MSNEPPHVVQARNELANAEALGQGDRASAARKVLAAAGAPPVREIRQAAGKRRAARSDRTETPQGRSTRQAQHSTTAKPDESGDDIQPVLPRSPASNTTEE